MEVRVAPGSAEVRVADTGPGIPPDDRARVFDRFYRVDKARSRDRGGSGLGLAVARSLVRAHGGRIDLDGEPGATAFTVRLPLNGDGPPAARVRKPPPSRLVRQQPVRPWPKVFRQPEGSPAP